MIKYRRQSEIERDIKKQNEKMVDQLEQQKRNLTQHIIRKQFNKESNNFAPPIDFNAFLENQDQNQQAGSDQNTYNVFGNQIGHDAIEKQTIDFQSRQCLDQQPCTEVQIPFLKKRFNTPPLSKTRLTQRQIQSKNYLEAERIIDIYAKDNYKPYNLASNYNIKSLNNILHSQSDFDQPILPTQPRIMTEQSESGNKPILNSESTLKTTKRIRRAVSEQGIKPHKKKTDCFPENEFYMYLNQVTQNRQKNNIVENSISKLLSILKDESTSEPKKTQPQSITLIKKNRRSLTDQKRVQFDENGKEKFLKPHQQLTKIQELSKKTFSKDNIKLFIRKILLNIQDYLKTHDNMEVPKHKLNHLGADRPKISQVIFSKSGFLRKDLTEDDFLPVIYPKDFVRSEEDRKNAPSADVNFDLNTYFDFMYFNSRLQEYITKKTTKALVKLERQLTKQTDFIQNKREQIIKDHQQKTIDKFRIRGQKQEIHTQVLQSEDNQSSYKNFYLKRQQYLMDYMNFIEKKLGNMDLISQLTRNAYNQVTDVIKEVKKHSNEI
ncbi:hypothetical protein ABPG72_007558 [Tetrahymena utriculariae]